ncbi:hypothetical protein PQQ51_13040 [Paraburkholderia xenovorans]|uniref:hypothetical protein n=1 Tax=Paraburkholderia xenovorans TaxID=36873 RepID=UPI0038BCF577
MKQYVCYAFALLVLSTTAVAQPLTPSRIERDVRTHGAHATVQSLNRTGRLDAVLSKIASGSVAWVRLSPDLAKGTDAGDSTGLSIALAQALPKNPKAVLAVLDDGPVTGAAVVCSVPLIEPSPDEVKDYLNRAIDAVRHTPDSGSLPQRAPCLQALKRIAEHTSAHPS